MVGSFASAKAAIEYNGATPVPPATSNTVAVVCITVVILKTGSSGGPPGQAGTAPGLSQTTGPPGQTGTAPGLSQSSGPPGLLGTAPGLSQAATCYDEARQHMLVYAGTGGVVGSTWQLPMNAPPAWTLLPLDAATASVGQPVKTLPPKFDAAGLVVEQHEATSTDGTKIPYFIVHRRDMKKDGSTPTIMTAAVRRTA